MFFNRQYICRLLCLVSLSAGPVAADDGWLADDESVPVNEGELELLAVRPDRPVHVHSNRIALDHASLERGWARLDQCHRNLDPVGDAQVVYNAERVRDLAVTRAEGIGAARVVGPTVQLENVSTQAVLCVRAESKVVHSLGDGRYAIRNGPFMRSFLDGYYPMHVQLEVVLPPIDWNLEKTTPAAQPGFSVAREQDRILVDAWFTGRLETALYFRVAD